MTTIASAARRTTIHARSRFAQTNARVATIGIAVVIEITLDSDTTFPTSQELLPTHVGCTLLIYTT
jgi:hypothetical protein